MRISHERRAQTCDALLDDDAAVRAAALTTLRRLYSLPALAHLTGRPARALLRLVYSPGPCLQPLSRV